MYFPLFLSNSTTENKDEPSTGFLKIVGNCYWWFLGNQQKLALGDLKRNSVCIIKHLSKVLYNIVSSLKRGVNVYNNLDSKSHTFTSPFRLLFRFKSLTHYLQTINHLNYGPTGATQLIWSHRSCFWANVAYIILWSSIATINIYLSICLSSIKMLKINPRHIDHNQSPMDVNNVYIPNYVEDSLTCSPIICIKMEHQIMFIIS